MNKILLVSLVHNRKQLLGLAIRSVLAQTLSSDKFDYLLWNNASTDGAEKIARIAAQKYKNFHMIDSKVNLKQQGAYNEILKTVIPSQFKNRHDIIVILDSDDELYPNALFEIQKVFSKHPEIGGAYTGFCLINSRGSVIVPDHGKAKLVPKQYTPEGQLALRRLFLLANPCGHARCYRISALNDIGGFTTAQEFSTDYAIFGQLLERFSVVKIDKVLYKFRQHGNQIQAKHSPAQTAAWHYYQDYFRERWKKLKLI